MLGRTENLVEDFVELQTDLLELAELVQQLNDKLNALMAESGPHQQSLARLCRIYLLLFEKHPQDQKVRSRLFGLLLLKLAAEIDESSSPRQETVDTLVMVEDFLDGKAKEFKMPYEEDEAIYNDDLLSYGEELVELGQLLEDFTSSCRDRLDLLHRVAVMYTNCYRESFYNHAQAQKLEERLQQFFFFCYAGEVRRSGRPGLSTVDMLRMLTVLQSQERLDSGGGAEL